MSNDPKVKETASEVEYAFDEVPASARKKMGTILVILTGYTISLSNFVTGATVGFKMPFKDAGKIDFGVRAICRHINRRLV